jgi:hypothetical protein
MQFSDLTKTIQNAWEFSWPPVIISLIFYWIAHFLNPVGTQKNGDEITAKIRSYGSRIENFRTLLEPYGLTKLVPVVSAVLVIGTLFIVNGPLLDLAGKLPPHIDFTPENLIAQTMSDEDKLLLLRKYPAAVDFTDAFYMAWMEHTKDKSTQIDNEAGLNFIIDNFIKLTVVYLIVLYAINLKSEKKIWSQSLKALLVAIILSVIWVFNFISLLKNQQNQFLNEWSAVRGALQKDAAVLMKDQGAPSEEMMYKMQSNEKPEKWWRFYIYDPYDLQWFKQTFLTE